MFKKRERAKKGVASSRESSALKRPNNSPDPRSQSSSARVSDLKRLSVSELQERYAGEDVMDHEESPARENLGPIDDEWEDEQLRKLGINLDRPAKVGNEEDPFREVKLRVEERIHHLKSELEQFLKKSK